MMTAALMMLAAAGHEFPPPTLSDAQRQALARLRPYLSKIRPKPRNDPQQWITYADAPRKSAPWGNAGRYGLIVSRSGVPTSCEIVQPTEDPLVDAKACRLLMTRARFFPALDSQGKPVESRYLRYVNWSDPAGNQFRPPPARTLQPAGAPPPMISLARAQSPVGSPSSWITFEDYPPEARALGMGGRVTITLRIGTSGVPISCTVLQSSGYAILDQTTCSLLMARARFNPAWDQRGKPIETDFKRSVTWKPD